MPLPKGTRVRVKTYPSGKRVRLAFKDNKVIETKNIDTGKIHTQAEFRTERRKGNPKTDAQRRALHKKLYGTSKLPPRGTGLMRHRT